MKYEWDNMPRETEGTLYLYFSKRIDGGVQMCGRRDRKDGIGYVIAELSPSGTVDLCRAGCHFLGILVKGDV